MFDNYNYQIVILETHKNLATSEEELTKQWEKILQENFKHYHILEAKIRKPNFQTITLATDQGTAWNERSLMSVWICKLDELKIDYRVARAVCIDARGASR